MRTVISVLSALFLATTLIGCGGTTIPGPPEGAKAGPPPGTNKEMLKPATKK